MGKTNRDDDPIPLPLAPVLADALSLDRFDPHAQRAAHGGARHRTAYAAEHRGARDVDRYRMRASGFSGGSHGIELPRCRIMVIGR
jgi:hypothetical protein